MKRIRTLLIIGFIALVGVTAWIVHSKIIEIRQEAANNATLGQFQRNLPIGMSRFEVEKYLRSRKITYSLTRSAGSQMDTYETKIGEGPNTIICDWTVYVALEVSASDKLQEVHIRKIGTCI